MGCFAKKDKKKGQVTIFILIGIAILVAIAVFFYFKSNVVQHELDKGDNNNKYLEEKKQAITFAVEDCVGTMIDEYVFSTGINGQGIQDYINSNYANCIDIESLISDDDLTVTKKNFHANVVMSTDEMNLKVDINYPIEVEAPYGKITFEDFSVDYKLYADIPLKTSGGVTTEHTMVKKGDIVFTVPSGTSASNDKITVKLINFPAGAEKTKLGPIYFDIYPKGATFSPPATLKYTYKEEFLHGYPEENIRLGWKNGAYWYPYVTVVYPEKNYIIGSIDTVH